MAIRAKTTHRLFILLGCMALIVILIGSVYAFRMSQHRADLLASRDKGIAAYEAGEYREALHQIGLYLQRNRDDAEATYLYAQARLNVEESGGSHVMQAMNFFRRVLELDPDHPTAQSELLELYQKTGFHSETVETARAQLRRDSQDVAAWQAKVRALGHLRNTNALLQLAERLLERDEAGQYTHDEAMVAEGYRARALARLEQRRYTDALDASRAHLQINPHDLNMQVLTLQLIAETNPSPAALHQHTASLAELMGDTAKYHVLAAHAHRLANETSRAREHLRQAAANPPVDDEPLLYMMLEEMDRTRMHRESLSMLELAVERIGTLGLRRAFNTRLIQRRRYEQVAAQLESLDPTASHSDSVLLALRAVALHQLDQPEEAALVINALRDRTNDSVAIAWGRVLTARFASDPDPAQIIQVIERTGDLGASNPFFQFWLGQAYHSLNEMELAVAAWERAARDAQSWHEPVIHITRAWLSTGRTRHAMAAANEAFQRAADDMGSALVLLIAGHANVDQLNASQRGELVTLGQQIFERAPGLAEAWPPYVGLLLIAGDQDEARAVVRTALDREQSISPDILRQLADLMEPVDATLAGTIREQAGQPVDQVMRELLELAQQGRTDDALARLQAHFKNADENTRQMAEVELLDRVRDSRAVQRWHALAEANPNQPRILMAMVRSNMAWADRDLMDNVITQLREATGEQALGWRMARARWLLEGPASRESLAEAQRLLQHVTQQAPAMLEARLLLAQAYRQQGNNAAAIQQLNRAVQTHPDRTDLHLELARQMHQIGENAQARLHLDRALRNSANLTAPQLRNAAILHAQQNRRQEAVALLVEYQDQLDIQGKLLLSWLYRWNDQLDAAEQLYDELLAQQPTPAVVEQAAAFFVAVGKPDRVDETLSLLDEMNIDALERQHLLARHYHRLGDREQTLSQLRQATRDAGDQPRAWHLRLAYEIETGQIDDALSTLDMAREQLTDDPVISEMHRHRRFIAAGKDRPMLWPLLTTLVSEPAQRPAAVEVLELVVPTLADGRSLDEIDGELERLAARHLRIMPIQTLAYGINQTLGQHEEAIRIATRAMQTFRDAPEPAWMAAEAFSAAGRWTEALSAAQEWRRRSGGLAVPADLMIAEAQLQLGRTDDALAQLSAHLEQARQDPDQFAPVLAGAARALAVNRQYDEAAQLLEPLLSQGSQWRVLWLQIAIVAIDDDDVAQAWFDRVYGTIPSDAAGEQFVLAQGLWNLGVHRNRADNLPRVTDLMRQAAEHPDATGDMLQLLAMSYEVSDDLPAAEVWYQRALELTPDLTVSMNNLAMVYMNQDKRLEDALALAQQAVDTEPDRPAFRDTLALAFYRTDDLENAIREQRQAIELDDTQPSFYLRLAEMLMSSQRSDEAQQVLAEFGQRFPDSAALDSELRDRLNELRQQLSQL